MNAAINRSTGVSAFEARFGYQPRTALDNALGVTAVSGTLPEWRAAAAVMHDSLQQRDAVFSLAQRAAHAAAPGTATQAFTVGETVRKFHHQRAHKLEDWYKPGYVITGLDDGSGAFYNVARVELDGTRSGEQRVAVSQLAKMDTSRVANSGAHLDVRAGHYVVESVVGHTISFPSGDVNFTVRWAGHGADKDSTANLSDLMVHVTPMLKSYCKTHKITWVSLVRQRQKASASPST